MQRRHRPTPTPESPSRTSQTDPATVHAPAPATAVATEPGGHDHSGHDHGAFISAEDGLYAGAEHPGPAVAGEQRRTANGADISGLGVSATSLDVTERIMATVAGREDIQDRLAEANTRVVIIPAGSSMTDLPEFAALKDQHTFDGRNWNDVRGQGGMQVGDEWLVAIPEENLIDHGTVDDTYHGEYSVGMHEIAHTIHSKGMSDDEREQLDALFAAQGEGGEFTGSYGASNVQEYFAQATNAYFGNNTVGENGADWLHEKDPDMHAFLEQIYGTPDEGIDRAEGVRDEQATRAVTTAGEELEGSE